MNSPDPVNHAAPYRGPIEAVRICLRKYVDFDGRASRSELWWFALFILLCEVFIIAVRLTWEDWMSYMPGLMPEFIVFAMFVLPATAVAARRLHDTGRGEWRLLFFFLPAAMLISILSVQGEMLVDVHPALLMLRVWMGHLVNGYGIPTFFVLVVALFHISQITFSGDDWMVAAIYIPLAMFAYSWANDDKASQNGFYFDGLPMYKKLLILAVLAVPVLGGIIILLSFIAKVVPEFLVFFMIPVTIPMVIFTYWWIQQGNPAQNKYDQTKTSRLKKLIVSGLPTAAVIYTVALLFYIVLIRS